MIEEIFSIINKLNDEKATNEQIEEMRKELKENYTYDEGGWS